MNVWNGIGRYPQGAGPVAATIGNYDGVHLGHQAILRTVVEEARARGVESLVITFEPHPLAVLAPHRKPPLIQTRRQKLDSFERAGVDGVLVLDFDDALAARDGEAFFEEVLGERVRFWSVHVGSNFRFGRDRHGDVELLRRIGQRRGFRVVTLAPVLVEGRAVCSTSIRTAVLEGRVEAAREMLGRPFEVTGEVVRGEGRGRQLSFPTANLAVENELLPRRGVYVTEAALLARRYGSVTNVGVRPTFGGRNLVVETHILDFDEDIYGERIALRFLARLRDEKRFSSPTDLADQIARDRAAAAAYFLAFPAARR
jgi:riboflavin kinase/FMN adenylyltransferase